MIEKHKKCPNCTTCDQKKFFSFQITNSLIWLLSQGGFEDIVLFNEKKCCKEMSQLILKCITNLCRSYRGKSSIWYRNFFREKFIITKKFKNINEKFYYTFLHEDITGKPLDYDVFMNDKEKMKNYYKYYKRFDCENGSRLTLKQLASDVKVKIKTNEYDTVKANLYTYYFSKNETTPFERDTNKTVYNRFEIYNSKGFSKKIEDYLTSQKYINFREVKNYMKLKKYENFSLEDDLTTDQKNLIHTIPIPDLLKNLKIYFENQEKLKLKSKFNSSSEDYFSDDY